MKKVSETYIPRFLWASIFLVLLAFALSVLRLGYKSLWIDEAASVYFARHAWPDLLWRLCDPHPPGYYAILKLALTLGGSSEFVVRFPSVLAGALAVAAMARLCRECRPLLHSEDRGTFWAWFSTALLAVAPLHLWYGQEARMYAWVTLLGLGAAVLLVRLAQRWHWTEALGYVMVAGAALTVDQSALLPLVVANLGFLVIRRWRRRQPGSCRSQGGVLRSELRCIRELWGSQAAWRTYGYWAGAQLCVVAVLGLWGWRSVAAGQMRSSTAYPLTMVQLVMSRGLGGVGPGQAVVALLVGLGGLTGGLALMLRRFRSLPAAKRQWWIVMSWHWFVLAAWGLATSFSVVPRLYTVKRLVVGVLPYALLLVGWSVMRLSLSRRRWLPAVVLGVSLVMCLLNVQISKPPWRDAIGAFSGLVESDDIIWVEDIVVPVFDYYAADHFTRQVLRVDDLDALSSSLSDGGRVWLLVGSRRYRDVLSLFPNLGPDGLVWVDSRDELEVRGYEVLKMAPGALAPVREVPASALNWPSPLDESCSGP